MDPGYTPDDGLPGRLRKEMRLLLHLDSIVHAQVEKVIDVAVTEWQAAEKGAVASAAEIAREEERAKDREACEASASEEAAEEEAYFEAFTSPRKPSKRESDQVNSADRNHRHKSHRGPSVITGYYGVKLDTRRKRYLATVNRRSYGTYATAEQAAHAYDGAALRDNIALGYDKHRLNFSRARTKISRAPEAISTPDLHCSGGLDVAQQEPAELENHRLRLQIRRLEGLLGKEDPGKTPPCSPPTI